MNDEEASISVIIPAFNAAAFIEACIKSVLRQTLSPLEILVVDDGSTDQTAELASVCEGVKLIKQPNAGPASARNAGIAAAQGDYLAFLDADDLMPPTRLQLQSNWLRLQPQFDAVVGLQRVFTDPAEMNRGAVSPGYVPSALLCRRDGFDRAGVFDERLRASEFIEWHQRAVAAGVQIGMAPKIVLHRRLHADSLSQQESVGGKDYVFMLKRMLDQQRSVGSKAA